MRRLPAAALVFLATFVALAFLALPVAAIFARVTPGKLVAQLGNPVVTDALLVSLKTTLVAQALVLVLGTPAAWVLATRRFRGRSLLVTLVELPLVLPPAVAGIGLLAAFGRTGLLHSSIPFTQTAVVLAVSFVARRSLRSKQSTRTSSPRRERSAQGPCERSSASCFPSHAAVSAPAPPSRSHAGSESSAPPSCSPAACAASRRRYRLPSMPSST